jgi:hypothetical protein
MFGFLALIFFYLFLLRSLGPAETIELSASRGRGFPDKFAFNPHRRSRVITPNTILNELILIQNSVVGALNLPLVTVRVARVLKGNSSVQIIHKLCVRLIDAVPIGDGQRSSRRSQQAARSQVAVFEAHGSTVNRHRGPQPEP